MSRISIKDEFLTLYGIPHTSRTLNDFKKWKSRERKGVYLYSSVKHYSVDREYDTRDFKRKNNK